MIKLSLEETNGTPPVDAENQSVVSSFPTMERMIMIPESQQLACIGRGGKGTESILATTIVLAGDIQPDTSPLAPA